MSAIRMLLVDDFAKFREAVREMLSTNHDFQVVGEAADGLEAVHMAEKLQPDLIVLKDRSEQFGRRRRVE